MRLCIVISKAQHPGQLFIVEAIHVNVILEIADMSSNVLVMLCGRILPVMAAVAHSTLFFSTLHIVRLAYVLPV